MNYLINLSQVMLKRLIAIVFLCLGLSGCTFDTGFLKISIGNSNKNEPPLGVDEVTLNIISSEEGELTIRNFFNLVDRQKYSEAFAIFSDDAKSKRTLINFQNGYKGTLSHTIESIFCKDNQCTASVTATEDREQDLRKTNYTFRYNLILDPNKKIRIDHSTLVDQSLGKVINTKVPQAKDSTIIQSVVKIFCLDLDTGLISQGSGTIINKNGTILSNQHIKGANQTLCEVYLSDDKGAQLKDSYRVTETIIENDVFDYWVFTIDQGATNLAQLRNSVCSKDKIEIGDSVRIYGYPSASGGNITVTDGLLSSFERSGLYYVTSAKIDQGNSGGAAVDVSKGCFLGIPTAASSGELESYGIILNINQALADYKYLFT